MGNISGAHFFWRKISMASLFMVMLGGRHKCANTEVHDVVFAIGDTLQDIQAQLKQAWFGELKGLHIDAWAKIQGISSQGKDYQFHFSQQQPAMSDLKLFLINLGGYSAHEFGELHQYKLMIAPNSKIAKQQAKQLIPQLWQKPHTDAVIDIDDCIPVDHVAGRYLHLVEGSFNPAIWQNTYLILDKVLLD